MSAPSLYEKKSYLRLKDALQINGDSTEKVELFTARHSYVTHSNFALEFIIRIDTVGASTDILISKPNAVNGNNLAVRVSDLDLVVGRFYHCVIHSDGTYYRDFAPGTSITNTTTYDATKLVIGNSATKFTIAYLNIYDADLTSQERLSRYQHPQVFIGAANLLCNIDFTSFYKDTSNTHGEGANALLALNRVQEANPSRTVGIESVGHALITGKSEADLLLTDSTVTDVVSIYDDEEYPVLQAMVRRPDGTDSHISLPHTGSVSNDFGAKFNFRIGEDVTLPTDVPLIGTEIFGAADNGWNIRIDNGMLHLFLRDSSIDDDGGIGTYFTDLGFLQTGQWYQVKFNYNSTTGFADIQLYQRGVGANLASVQSFDARVDGVIYSFGSTNTVYVNRYIVGGSSTYGTCLVWGVDLYDNVTYTSPRAAYTGLGNTEAWTDTVGSDDGTVSGWDAEQLVSDFIDPKTGYPPIDWGLDLSALSGDPFINIPTFSVSNGDGLTIQLIAWLPIETLSIPLLRGDSDTAIDAAALTLDYDLEKKSIIAKSNTSLFETATLQWARDGYLASIVLRIPESGKTTIHVNGAHAESTTANGASLDFSSITDMGILSGEDVSSKGFAVAARVWDEAIPVGEAMKLSLGYQPTVRERESSLVGNYHFRVNDLGDNSGVLHVQNRAHSTNALPDATVDKTNLTGGDDATKLTFLKGKVTALRDILATVALSTLLSFYKPTFNTTQVIDLLGEHDGDMQPDRCYDFDGTDDTVSLPASNDFDFGTGVFTIALWAKFDASTDNLSVIFVTEQSQLERYLSFRLNNNGRLQMAYRPNTFSALSLSQDDTGTAGTDLKDDAWHHIAVTRNGDTMTFYVDAVEDYVSKTSGSTSGANNVDWDIDITQASANQSGNNIGDGGVFGGANSLAKFAHFGMWSKALTASDLTQVSAKPSIPEQPSLIRFFKMDEKSGTISLDSSAAKNNGTITNAAASFHGTDIDLPAPNYPNTFGYTAYYNMDADDDHVDLGANPFTTGDFAIKFKLLYRDTDSVVGLLASGQSYRTNNTVPGWMIRTSSAALEFRLKDDQNVSVVAENISTALAIGHLYSVEILVDRGGLVTPTVTDLTSNADASEPAFDASSESATLGTETVYVNRYADVANYNSGSIIYDLEFFDDATASHRISHYRGYNRDWTDQEGRSDGTVMGSPDTLIVPRDESQPSKDALGIDLQNRGRARVALDMVESDCAYFDGLDDKIVFSDLSGVTITSYQGTATLSINGNAIEGTAAGTAYNLVLSDGTHLPLAGGLGTDAHDVSGNGNDGVITNAATGVGQAFWGSTQNDYHYNLLNGYTLVSGVKVPALSDGSLDAQGNAIGRPAGNWHNGAETKLQVAVATHEIKEINDQFTTDLLLDGSDDPQAFDPSGIGTDYESEGLVESVTDASSNITAIKITKHV